MHVVMFYHSLRSDWNHGNAHFLRGVATELLTRGHRVTVYEPADAWSAANLVADQGPGALERYRTAYPAFAGPRFRSVVFDPATLDLDAALGTADLVLVHEWNAHSLVARIGAHRAATGAAYRLLFHDTHHRSATAPAEMARYDLSEYDGALTFGEVIRERYLLAGWAARAWTWHEAADVRVFRPVPDGDRAERAGDLVWIGNWGDGERSAELHEFLIEPARALGLRAMVHGVRYPPEARRALADAAIAYGGWLPNFEVPCRFARYAMTVHVPRRAYARCLPGIPTIRVFEALACGIPLVSAPWDDAEGLFSPGSDYLIAMSGNQMRRHLRVLRDDSAMAQEVAARGRAAIMARHTCGHRVDELLRIVEALTGPAPAALSHTGGAGRAVGAP